MRYTRFSHRTQDVRKDNTGLMCKWHWQSHRKTSLLERDSYFAPTSTLFKELFNEASICSVPAQPSEWCAIDTPLCCLSKESFCSLCNYRGTSQLYWRFLPLKHTHFEDVGERRSEGYGWVSRGWWWRHRVQQYNSQCVFLSRHVLESTILRHVPLFQQAFRWFLSRLVKCLTFWFNQHPWLPVELDHYQKCARYAVSLTCQRPTHLLIYLSHSSSHGDTL